MRHRVSLTRERASTFWPAGIACKLPCLRRITKTIVDTDSYPTIRLFHKVHMRFFRESEFRAPIYIFLKIKFSH